MAKDIFYRPQLEHKKNYYTEGKVETASDFAPDVDEQSQGNLENKLDIIEDYVNKKALSDYSKCGKEKTIVMFINKQIKKSALVSLGRFLVC